MLQRRGSSFRNGSESGGKPFWTVREEGKLAKLTSKKKNQNKTKQKTFQLSSALTIGLHTNPTNPTNVSMDPLEASEVDCVPRYILEQILY
jgi:hypothetical protein